MRRVIVNEWVAEPDGGVLVASILRHDSHPEGLDFKRVRFSEAASYSPSSDLGLFASVLKGELRLQTNLETNLTLVAGTHVYLPAGSAALFAAVAGTELLLVLSPDAKRARGTSLLLRDDQFLAACAMPGRPLRWILTAQYLSRRVFLHHDQTLVSPLGDPLSWFHTTMFDVEGLPLNDEERPVFKMSYNFRTEPNVCFDVAGEASVRMAEHAYQNKGQRWGPWQCIDAETTYHLNEGAGSAEWIVDEGERKPRRNKHEIRIVDGHVSLMCMHNPAPTGAERHSAGEYSEYGNLAETLLLPEYKEYLALLKPLEHMVDTLSLAKARGEAELATYSEWEQYQAGLVAQRENEAALAEGESAKRQAILRPWMLAQ